MGKHVEDDRKRIEDRLGRLDEERARQEKLRQKDMNQP